MADGMCVTSTQGAAMPGTNEYPGRHMPKRSSEVLDNKDCNEMKPRKRRREDYGATLEATKVVFSDESFEVGASVGKVLGRGHSYEELQMSGNSRMHAGDTHNGINISGSVTNLRVCYGAAIESKHEWDVADQVMSDLRLECKKTALEFLRMLQRLFSRVALPKQVARQVAYLEDALGNFHEIDAGLMDWTSLHCRIASTFSGKSGHLRVARESYRLFDRSRNMDLIDPKDPPTFADVFQSGRHIRMSMHFELCEFAFKRFSNYSLAQGRSDGSKPICICRNVSYQGCTGNNGQSHCMAVSWTKKHSGRSDTMSEHLFLLPPLQDQDNLSHFQRISISGKKFVNGVSTYHSREIPKILAPQELELVMERLSQRPPYMPRGMSEHLWRLATEKLARTKKP